jgi:hypothetical protein
LEFISVGLPSAIDEGQLWQSSVGGPTPGKANSAGAVLFAPVINNVRHDPPIPTPSDSVRITAKMVDVPGTSITTTLHYRTSTLSPGAFQQVTMLDNALHGDGAAND